LEREAAGQVNDDAANRAYDPPADLEQLESNRADLGGGQFRPGKSHAAKRLYQDVGPGRQQDAELVGQERMATGAVGEQAQLLLLDAILGIAALTIEIVVEVLRVVRQGCDDKARVLALVAVLCLGDNAAMAVPGSGGIGELLE
jgi:hypothetical protein